MSENEFDAFKVESIEPIRDLRDEFAGRAMQGIMSCESTNEILIKDYEKMIDVVATGSYLIADAMMKARKK